MSAPIDPHDLLDIDHLLSDDERAVRDTAREWVRGRILPEVEDWYEAGDFPARELAKELGEMGFLGMQLKGEGMLGLNAVAYGLVELELEAGDSGLRSFVSVQSALAMFAILTHGSDEQRAEWLPRMTSGEAIGCFGLSEPDSGSDPGSMRTFARREGEDWVLSGTKMWITNGSVSDVAIVWANTDDGVRGFVVPCDVPGLQRTRHSQEDVAAGERHQRAGDGRRAPARGGGASGGRRLEGPAVVPQRGAVRDRLGRDGRGPGVLRVCAELLEGTRAVRQADRRVPADSEEARRHGARDREGHPARATTSAG